MAGQSTSVLGASSSSTYGATVRLLPVPGTGEEVTPCPSCAVASTGTRRSLAALPLGFSLLGCARRHCGPRSGP